MTILVQTWCPHGQHADILIHRTMEPQAVMRRGLVITDRQLDRCDNLLRELKSLLDCSFLALVSTSVQPITTASEADHPETLSLASLTASAFAATRQLA